DHAVRMQTGKNQGAKGIVGEQTQFHGETAMAAFSPGQRDLTITNAAQSRIDGQGNRAAVLRRSFRALPWGTRWRGQRPDPPGSSARERGTSGIHSAGGSYPQSDSDSPRTSQILSGRHAGRQPLP